MKFGEDEWKRIKAEDKAKVEANRKHRKTDRRQVAKDKAEKAAARKRYQEALHPTRPKRTKPCKSSHCQVEVLASATYCTKECGVEHRQARRVAREAMVLVYKKAIEEGWYQMPSAEQVAEAMAHTAWMADSTSGNGVGRLRFSGKDPLRSREWAEQVVAAISEKATRGVGTVAR